MTHPKLDEAALKADPSDSEIMEIAGRWFHTGENQHRADGYYYRSLGTPTNVRGSDLIAFARALLHRSQPVAVVPAEQAEDSAMLDWLDKNNARFQMGWRVGIAPAGNASIQSVIQLGGQPLTSIRAAIRAAIGRNREAGGS